MLLGIMAVLSLLTAGAVCVGCHAFSGLNWLWVAPVTFVGAFAVLFGIAFASCICMQPGIWKKEEKRKPVLPHTGRVYIRRYCSWCRRGYIPGD